MRPTPKPVVAAPAAIRKPAAARPAVVPTPHREERAHSVLPQNDDKGVAAKKLARLASDADMTIARLRAERPKRKGPVRAR